MNWYMLAGIVLHLLKHAPEIVHSIEHLVDELTTKEPPPPAVAATIASAIAAAKRP